MSDTRSSRTERTAERRGRGRAGDRPDPPPWRTEGMPESPRPPRWTRILGWLLLGWLFFFAVTTIQDLSGPRVVTVPYTEFTQQVDAGNVEEIYSRGETIQGTLVEDAPLPEGEGTYQVFATERPTFAQDDLLSELNDTGAEVRATPVVEQRGVLSNLFISMLPLLLLIGFWVWMFRRAQKRAGGAGLLGGSKAKPIDPEEVRVSFDDVAGIDEVKAEVSEIVDFLRNPDKYKRLGAKVPRGVLLEGAPGTGKTLLARATAGEAGVPFFSASASEFIEMIVGVGAQRVRQLFEEARKVAPAIIFIDEIDTIGRSRSSARAMGGNDEREQTLNQILTEMDGFDGSEGVVVLAATNRADVLDEAALLAARRQQDQIFGRDFADALEKVQLGSERSVVIPEEERRRTAYHEAGHALLGMLQPGADPVRKISIIPRGRALGVTLSTPDTDRYGYDTAYLRGRIIGALGGMAAEEVVFGVVTTGAESDLQTATAIARQMVGRWGMSPEVGPVQVYPHEGDPRQAGVSEGLLESVDREVRTLIEECYEEAKRLLVEHRDRLEALVEALLEKEALDEADAYQAAGVPPPTARPQLVGATSGGAKDETGSA